MGFSPFGGIGDMMFNVMPVIVVVGFVVVFGMMILRGVQGVQQWKGNNESPVLTVSATMVTKRMNISHSHHSTGNANDMHHVSSSTTYYATFEVESGDRMEFVVCDTEYGMLVENDQGRLTFQGTRYLGFERGL